MRQGGPLAPRAAEDDQRPHPHRAADAHRLHVGPDELHRVVDRRPAYTEPPGELTEIATSPVATAPPPGAGARRRRVRDLLVDRRAEEDDPVLQEARVDVDHPSSRASCQVTIGIPSVICVSRVGGELLSTAVPRSQAGGGSRGVRSWCCRRTRWSPPVHHEPRRSPPGVGAAAGRHRRFAAS